MKGRIWLIGFALCLLADLVLIREGNVSGRMITKPLLMPLLAGWFFTHTSGATGILKTRVLAALFFSWAGDTLLLFEPRSSLFFLAGLTSFLIAHLFYIFTFLHLFRKQGRPFRFVFLLPVLMYYSILIAVLYGSLGAMKIPVIVYGAVISTMLLMALQLSKGPRSLAVPLIAGAVLFVVSDSLLAYHLFYQTFPGAGPLIMLTYGAAQWLICLGITRSIRLMDLPDHKKMIVPPSLNSFRT